MKAIAIATWIVAAIVLCAEPGLAGGKRDGQSCHTHRSCESKVCTRIHPIDKFGVCCTPLDCPALGAQCGQTTDGCGLPIECGSCGQGQSCVANQCVADTTTTTSSTTSTTSTTSSTTSTSTSSTTSSTLPPQTTTTLGGGSTTTSTTTTSTTLPGQTTTTSTTSTTSTTWDGVTCLGEGGKFRLFGEYANVDECADALALEADTRCCSGQLDPDFGFEYSPSPPLCRGYCYYAP